MLEHSNSNRAVCKALVSVSIMQGYTTVNNKFWISISTLKEQH